MFTPFRRGGLNMFLAKNLLALVAMRRNQGTMSIFKPCELREAVLNAEFSWTPDPVQQVVCDTCDMWTPVYATTTWADS